MVLAIYFYDVVLSLHLMAVVLAFGVFFAYPLLFSWLRANAKGALAGAHEAQGRIATKLITPAATVALICGIYLASDRHYWSRPWVGLPFVILLAILGIVGGFFTPQEKRLAELARADSPDYAALARKVQTVQYVVCGLVLLAIFMMAAKPGGYS